MAAIMRKLSPFKPVVVVTAEEEHEYDYEDQNFLSTEYSIAIEYTGPPISYEIPHAFPVDFDRISTALSSSPSRNLSLVVPVIQPIVTTTAKSKPKVKPDTETEIIELPTELENYMNPRRSSDSTEENSDRGSHSSLSSETASEEDHHGHHKRKPSVTFLEPESHETWRSESFAAEDSIATPPRQRRAVREGRKGSCYRCRRGGRLTWKEQCIVCSAKYCGDCVLRSMGSMPEGRKCLGCIGERIDEAVRPRLGRSSRMLRRLLCNREVEHIMKAEVNCPANQLPAGLIQVNGRRISSEELVLLKTCGRPPRRLKPGRYWYDKVSGFWGKVGQVYSDIISPQLNVGGDIDRKCSNGNTNIRINNREITKAELWILQVAGVPCEGDVHYWVNPDGTYQEEGMNMKGKIWDKPRVKLACALLSLPILSGDSEPLTTEEVKRAAATQSENTKLYNFLLLGSDQSGTSTIFKQVKRLCEVPFSDEERQSIKSMIQSKLYGYIGLLLEGRERFEEEEENLRKKGKSTLLFDQPGPSGIAGQETTTYSIGQRLKSFEEWLLKVMTSGNLEVMIPAATREYAQYVEDLWKDPAIKATYSRRNELETLPRAASYFLDRAIEISKMDYEPTDLDILYAEGISSSNNVASIEFPCPRFCLDNNVEVLPGHKPDQVLRSRLIRAHPKTLGENCKWLSMFEESEIVLFCFSLSDYTEPERMSAARDLFEKVATHPDFRNKPFLLLLNKFDLLEETIERVPLSRCDWFLDFRPVVTTHASTSGGARGGNNPPLPHRAFQYIAMKFKVLFKSLTGRKLYVSLINGLESDTVEESLKFAAEILKWDEQRHEISSYNQVSDASIEASSSS